MFLQIFIHVAYLVFAYLILYKKISVNLKLVYILSAIIATYYLITFTSLSTDIYRYIWDGQILYHGFNPYFYKASDTIFSDFQQSYELYPKMAWIHEYTVYPPIAQFIFFIAYIAYSFTGLIGAKIIFAIPVIATFLLIKKYLTKDIYALFILNPLILFEGFNGAHLDNFLLLIVTASFILMMKNKLTLAGILLVVGVFIKLFPLIFLPIILLKLIRTTRSAHEPCILHSQKVRLKQFKSIILLILVFIAAFVFLYGPFLIFYPTTFDQSIYNLFGLKLSLFPITRYTSYIGSFEFNDGLYRIFQSNLISYSVFLLFYSLLIFKSLFLIGFIFLLLGPVFFPWYILFIVGAFFIEINRTKKYHQLFMFIILELLLTLTYVDNYPLKPEWQLIINNFIWTAFHILSWGFVIYKLTKSSLSKIY